MYNGETGDLMFKSAVPGARRITRRGLREVLSDELEIQWGRRVTRLDTELNSEKVKVTLQGEEGVEEEVWADYVLGTDGAGSKVREILFANQENGEEKAKAKRSGFMIGTCVVDYQDEDVVRKVLEKHPVMAMAMSRGAVGAFGGEFSPFPLVDVPKPRKNGKQSHGIGMTAANTPQSNTQPAPLPPTSTTPSSGPKSGKAVSPPRPTSLARAPKPSATSNNPGKETSHPISSLS